MHSGGLEVEESKPDSTKSPAIKSQKRWPGKQNETFFLICLFIVEEVGLPCYLLSLFTHLMIYGKFQSC